MKIICVSVIVKGRRYFGFTASTDGTVSLTTLERMFPVMRELQRGETWSYG